MSTSGGLTHEEFEMELLVMAQPETDGPHYREALAKVRAHDAALRAQMKLGDELCVVLSGHCSEAGVSEGAVATLTRIIAERDHHKWKQEQNEQEVDRLRARVEELEKIVSMPVSDELAEARYAIQVHADVLGETIHKHEKEVATLQQQLAIKEVELKGRTERAHIVLKHFHEVCEEKHSLTAKLQTREATLAFCIQELESRSGYCINLAAQATEHKQEVRYLREQVQDREATVGELSGYLEKAEAASTQHFNQAMKNGGKWLEAQDTIISQRATITRLEDTIEQLQVQSIFMGEQIGRTTQCQASGVHIHCPYCAQAQRARVEGANG